MIPTIWRHRHPADVRTATKEASAAVGIIGAVGALGGFLIPMMFGAPWIDDPVSSVKVAFSVFIAYYVLCALVTWSVYVRRGARLAVAAA